MPVRRFKRSLITALMLCLASPSGLADITYSDLPDLGAASREGMSPTQERELGEGAIREIRRSGVLVDDPEVNDYIRRIGGKLADATGETGQPFHFYVLLDKSVNAFAMPGGFVVVHSGLLAATQSESELASVMAHEVAHVTQHHLARMVDSQRMTPWMLLGALGLAIIASKAGNSGAGVAAVVGSQGYAIQRQLDFTYAFEQEADRIGMQTLQKSGFDPAAMPLFFQRLQKENRLVEGGAPEFLRTHPVTYKRIADAEARLKGGSYKQYPDSTDYRFVREKLRVLQMGKKEAVTFYRTTVEQKRYASLAMQLYGYALAQWRDGQYDGAWKTLGDARSAYGKPDAALDYLAGQIRLSQQKYALATTIFQEAAVQFPSSRGLLYGEIDALVGAERYDDALARIHSAQELYTSDANLYQRESRVYAAMGQVQRQHKAQAEYYARILEYGPAIEQLQLAQRQPGGDFYLQSEIDARLQELMVLDGRKDKRGEPSKLDASAPRL
ncbi:M48 family metalloprotease [Jeongeupia naejangsanensis]|uniref:M48 family metallopeptidase n=1 Tax=Jeongeupia naejangsanensis TaxID=613195 RepID=A0ABS2BKZ1_9NEIS|nr:M48 family metalloprotease [Jeongeupia naejangsanensis]MBM3116274.1 M48 family metallopeptidase [Jeongeupia naejangsanensis]